MHEEDGVKQLPRMRKTAFINYAFSGLGFCVGRETSPGIQFKLNELRIKCRNIEKSGVQDSSRRMAARRGLGPSAIHSEGVTLSQVSGCVFDRHDFMPCPVYKN